MKRNIAVGIAVVAALIITGAFFYRDFLGLVGSSGLKADYAWAAFAGYREAAANHDLTTLRRHSYQLSPSCQDEARIAECTELMDSVATITSTFTREEFKHGEFNDSGGLLYTDYIVEENTMGFIISFKESEGEYKVREIRFCLKTDPEETRLSENCLVESRASLNTTP